MSWITGDQKGRRGLLPLLRVVLLAWDLKLVANGPDRVPHRRRTANSTEADPGAKTIALPTGVVICDDRQCPHKRRASRQSGLLPHRIR